MKLSDLCILDEGKTAKLFVNCPALESLTISRCNMNLNNVYAPKLKCFIYENNGYQSDGVSIIRLCAPNLTSLGFRSCLTHKLDYSALNINSPLVTAKITMGVEEDEEIEDSADEAYRYQSTEEKELYAQNMLKLLKALSTMKNLTLSRWLIKLVSEAPNLVDYESLQLSSVQSLTLRPFLSKDCFRTITYLLNISPNLESLEVIIYKSPFNDEPELYPFCDEECDGSVCNMYASSRIHFHEYGVYSSFHV
ncbi:uncharacterized protein LOC113320710 [Papaver somniferum]|uniref:uncharacterized protein LOC113320710 n=1 Tax=Papaver somniferum TaxID=3469 RepID=UPI000E6F6D31|nr:uncharacterized protein LOC113320710 [Papaver somniferum]